MENENKKDTIKRIIQIVLLALLIFTGLIFLIFPPIWAHDRGVITLNNHLVNREKVRNGTIDITTENYGDVLTINSGFATIIDRNYFMSQEDIDTLQPIGGISDFLGLGFTNYFRFVPTDYHTPNTVTCYALQYYMILDQNNSMSFNLGYYDIYEDSDDVGAYMYYGIISRSEFDKINVIPEFNVLNFSYYNLASYDTFVNLLATNGFDNLLYYGSNYQVSPKFQSFITWQNTHIVHINQDTITNLVSSARDEGYQEGFDKGYDKGFGDANSSGNIFDTLRKAVYSLTSFLSIEILPNFTMWMLLSIPFACSIMVILFKLLRGGN